MTKNLTVGAPLRLITLFTLPLLVGNLFQQAYAVTDTIVIGRMIGVNALAAVGASGSLQFLLFGFAMGASAGFAIPVARAYGAGDLPAMRRAVAMGAFITLAVAVVITAVGTLGASTLLTGLGTPPELMGQATTFLAVLFSGSIVTSAFNYLSAVIRALGDSQTPLYFLVFACLLNVALVMIFIGVLGAGVGGAALATVLAQFVSVVLCLLLVWRRMPDLHLQRADWRPDVAQLRESTKLGLTLGFQMSIIAIGAAMLQFGINGLGTDAVAAFTSAMRVDQVAVIPMASIGVAMTTYVAQNAGAHEWGRVRVGFRKALMLSLGMSVLLGVLIFVFGTHLVRVFVGPGQERVVEMAHLYLVVNSALYSLLAILFLVRSTIQGLGSTLAPTLAGVFELVARGVIGLFVVQHVGFIGVVLAAPAAWVAALLPLLTAWGRHRRKLTRRDAEETARRLNLERSGDSLEPCHC